MLVDMMASIRRIPPNAPIQAKSQISYFSGILVSQIKGGKGRGAYGGLAPGGRYPVKREMLSGSLLR